MPLPRTSLFRLPLRTRIGSSVRQTRSSNLQRIGQQSQRRGYSSAQEHTVKSSGSDIPWLIGSVVVTAPATWWILQPSANHGEGHDDHGAHAKHDEEEEETDDSADESKEDSEEKDESGDNSADGSKDEQDDDKAKSEEESEDKDDQKDEEKDASGKSDDKSDDKDDKDQGEDDSEDEGKSKADGRDKVKELGSPVKGDKKKEEAKGATKKRIDSTNRKDIGDENSSGGSPGSQNTQYGKQAGMSSTPTRHSTDPTEGGKSSMKGEGTAETAKITGTVDPGRKQV